MRLPSHACTLLIIAAAAVALAWPDLAWASDSGGGSLPWETPLKTISNSLSGPVAYAIALTGIVVTGAMLVWGGEINEFARRVIMLVLVISLIVVGKNVLTTLFTSASVIN